MNNSLKNFSLEDLKKEVAAREERNAQIENWKNTVLKNYLSKNAPSKSQISHIMDYFQGCAKLPNLSRLSYPDAHKKSLDWTKAINLKNKNLQQAGLTHKILDLDNGFKIVRLVDQVSRNWEGLQMGNCVADYNVNAKLYSLRDADEFPHITIELSENQRSINEIKGKANTVPSSKYLNHIFKFLEHNDIVLMNEDYQSLGLIRLSPENKEYLEYNFSGYIYSTYDNVLYLRHDSPLILKEPLTTINEYLFNNFVECNICFEAQRQWIALGIDFPHEYLTNAIYAASLEDIKFAMDKDPHVQREIHALRNYVQMLKHSHGTDEEISEVKDYLKDLIYKETFVGWKEHILHPFLDQINYDKKEYRQLALFIKKEKEQKDSSTFPRSEHDLKYFIQFYEFSKKYPGKEVYTIPKEGEALVCSSSTEKSRVHEISSWALPLRYNNHYCYTFYNIESNVKLGIVLAHQDSNPLVLFDKKQAMHGEMFVKSLFSLLAELKRRGLKAPYQNAGLISLSQFGNQSNGQKPFSDIKTEYQNIFNHQGTDYFFKHIPVKFSEVPHRQLTANEIMLLTLSQSKEAFLKIEIDAVVASHALISAANMMNIKMVEFLLEQDTGYLKNNLAHIIIKTSKYQQRPFPSTQLIIDHARNKYGLFPKDMDWFSPSSSRHELVADDKNDYIVGTEFKIDKLD